jgi:hypothetical protein
MLPTKILDTPVVALEPTAHHTLSSCPPFTRYMAEWTPVMTVDPAWKIHMPLTSPLASRSRTLLAIIEKVPAQYTPGIRVFDEMSAAIGEVQTADIAALNAAFWSAAH